jgi:hypothetical protein
VVNVRPDSELSTAPAVKKTEPKTEIAANAGQASEATRKAIVPPPGRADNFSWPAPD